MTFLGVCVFVGALVAAEDGRGKRRWFQVFLSLVAVVVGVAMIFHRVLGVCE